MFKVYEESKKQENKDVYLRFKEASDGVIVCAVDESGKELPAGNLILFKHDGYIKRFQSVNPGIGFLLNDFSQIAVEGNEDKFKTEGYAKEKSTEEFCSSCGLVHK